MNIDTIFIISSIFSLCAVCQWVAWKVKLPPIIFLLLTGIGVGPVFQLINPDVLLNELLFPFVSLAVAIILFEGSLTLKFREMKGLHIVVRNLVSVGMVVTWMLITVSAQFLLSISWEVAALYGAIMVVTGPTVIAPILRTVRPISSVANILKWESIVIDPIGASLAVLVYEFIISGGGGSALGKTLVTFGELVGVGAAVGAVAGYVLGLCLRYHIIPEFLHNISALAAVFLSFAMANSIQNESGLVTVTVFGIWLANMKGVDLEHILAFKETLSILLISMLFIILAARLDLATVQQLGWNAILLCLVIQFVARPINIFVSAAGSALNLREKLFLAWIAPRGIVAAAISSLFALKLEEYGYAEASILVPLSFLVIFFTVILQSVTAGQIGKKLKIILPDPEGFLIIGANPVARTIGRSLENEGFSVVLADSDRDDIHRAKKDGLMTYLGNPISEHASKNLDLSAVGTLLALSSVESENVAAVFHFRSELGRSNVYSLKTTLQGRRSSKWRAMPQLRGKTLFNNESGYSELYSLIQRGAKIHHHKVKEGFSFDLFFQYYGRESIPLFGIDTKMKIHCFNKEHTPVVEKGWSVLYLGSKDQSEKEMNYQI